MNTRNGHAGRLALLVLLPMAGCAPRSEVRPAPAPPPSPAARATAPPATPAPAPALVVAVPAPAADTARGPVPYRGPLPPAHPPMRVPPGERPLSAWQAAALDVLYERPSPQGPPPLALEQPRAVYAVGRGPVIQVLPGELVFAEHLPQIARTAMPAKGPFSNHVVRLPRGEVRFAAFDRTLNDTKVSNDSMAVDIQFTDRQGARWRILQAALAPLSPDPVNEPWFGGVVIDTTLHGKSGRATPAEPWLRCAMCSWGWADVWKNDKKVASGVLLHMMLTSDVRDDARDFAYACYDCRDRPIREVHVIIPPTAHLPTPGGFLHVMWENAEIRRGTPRQIARAAPRLEKPMETITLRAVPYLQWSDTTLRVEAGKRYRLVLQNDDPSSAHAMHLHMTPGYGHGGGGEGQQGSHGHGQDSHGTHVAASDGFPSADGEIKVPMPPAETWVTTVEFERPGEYHFYCPVWNHHARGMTGKFIVSAPRRQSRNGGAR